jgi:hypothetical protein
LFSLSPCCINNIETFTSKPFHTLVLNKCTDISGSIVICWFLLHLMPKIGKDYIQTDQFATEKNVYTNYFIVIVIYWISLPRHNVLISFCSVLPCHRVLTCLATTLYVHKSLEVMLHWFSTTAIRWMWVVTFSLAAFITQTQRGEFLVVSH